MAPPWDPAWSTLHNTRRLPVLPAAAGGALDPGQARGGLGAGAAAGACDSGAEDLSERRGSQAQVWPPVQRTRGLGGGLGPRGPQSAALSHLAAHTHSRAETRLHPPRVPRMERRVGRTRQLTRVSGLRTNHPATRQHSSCPSGPRGGGWVRRPTEGLGRGATRPRPHGAGGTGV